MQQIIYIFISVFMAELGDKTQLAALLFASSGNVKTWHVFLASSLALVTSTAIAVLIGHFASQHLSKLPLKLFAGIGFVAIGSLTIWDYFKG